MVEPINPGPLMMSAGGFLIVAIDLVDGATDAPDSGYIAELMERPNWQAHAAWLVRASNEFQEWQPIETCPDDDTFLVWMEEKDHQHQSHVGIARWHKNIQFVNGNFLFDMPKVTHWMPLPKPPVPYLNHQ